MSNYDPLLGRLDGIARDATLPPHVTIAAHDAADAIRSNDHLRAERDAAWRRITELENPFRWRGTWHVRHADGTTEDIVLEHGNLVEDNTGSCGQFLLGVPAADTATQDDDA